MDRSLKVLFFGLFFFIGVPFFPGNFSLDALVCTHKMLPVEIFCYTLAATVYHVFLQNLNTYQIKEFNITIFKACNVFIR